MTKTVVLVAVASGSAVLEHWTCLIWFLLRKQEWWFQKIFCLFLSDCYIVKLSSFGDKTETVFMNCLYTQLMRLIVGLWQPVNGGYKKVILQRGRKEGIPILILWQVTWCSIVDKIGSFFSPSLWICIC